MAIITTENLTKIYQVPVKQGLLKSIFVPKNKEVVAVRDVSLKVDEGEAVAFLGPNGAGKTTTLKMLTGLLYPTSGRAEVLGFVPTERKYEFLRQIALVMGNKTGLAWDLSANQNYKLFVSIYQLTGKQARNTVKELSQLLEVEEVLDVPVRKLSLGQRLKLELVGAILHRPKLLFLDEPTIGLDVVSKRKIRQFLNKLHREEGTTIILTSHEMADIQKVCDRVIVINQGQIVFDDLLERLNSRYRDKKYLTVTLMKKMASEEIKKFGKIIDSKELSYTLEVDRRKQSEVIAAMADQLPVDDIDLLPVPLDEIIEDIFQKTKK